MTPGCMDHLILICEPIQVPISSICDITIIMLFLSQEPLKLDIVISFPDHGFHLRFDPWSQVSALILVGCNLCLALAYFICLSVSFFADFALLMWLCGYAKCCPRFCSSTYYRIFGRWLFVHQTWFYSLKGYVVNARNRDKDSLDFCLKWNCKIEYIIHFSPWRWTCFEIF